MNLILLLCLIQVVWGANWDFYHELSVETFQPPQPLRQDSYFGFSSAYDKYNRRMIISAPREDNVGVVYECDLSKATLPCLKVGTTITREAPKYTHDYWFGATVKAGPDYILACAPRYSRVPSQCTYAGTYGRCYKRVQSSTQFAQPLFPPSVTKSNCENQEKQMDSMGWSMDIHRNETVLFGSPAMFHDSGVVVEQPIKITKLLSRLSINIHNVHNLGYSVAAGYFISDKISYAIGTTYGTVGSGQVYFYIPVNKITMTLNKVEDVNVIGSMFGAVLCAAKMNELVTGNDLIVGAPTYASTSEYNTGAVYVYEFKVGELPKFLRKIVGYKMGSLFGSAILNVGDLNGDNRDEIAIGAPFEDAGAVYLYSGAAIFSESRLTWLQRITPADKNIVSFGYSLTALQDYDDNGCNELAVGAPYKDRVMLYKCLAAVTITKMYASFPNVKNRTQTQTDFVMEFCMDVKYSTKPVNVIGELSTDVKIDHVYATLKNPNNGNVYTFKTSLQSKKLNYCEKVGYVLPVDKDYSTQIRFEFTTKLLNSPINMKHVTGSHVILSDKSQLNHTDVFWATECFGAVECIPSLSWTITSDMKERPFITGSRDNGAFHVQVLNTGDVAYDPCLQFSVSGGNLQTPPMFCSKDKTLEQTWLCKSTKPVRTNATWEINNIKVDLRGLTNQDKEVGLNIKLFDRCSDTTSSKTDSYSIPLTSNSDGIYIIGSTDMGEVDIGENEVLFSKHFEQVYKIINKGPTNFKHLIATVKLDKKDFITYSSTPVSIHADGTVLSKGIHEACRVNINDKFKMVLSCPIYNLNKNQVLTVKIALETNPDVLTYAVLKKQSVEVNSTLTVYIDGQSKSSMLPSLIQLQEGFVAPWVFIVAALFGLLLLILIAFILYKSGFLKRKNKKKLSSLKENVRRQTIRQSTAAPPAGDRNQILENMEVDEDGFNKSNPEPTSAKKGKQ